DPDRTDFQAGATEGAGMWQRRVLLQSLQQGRDHRADRAAVRAPVGVPPGLTIDRASIQAGAAANTLEHLLVFSPQLRAAAIIEEDDMHLARSVAIIGPGRSRDERGVD